MTTLFKTQTFEDAIRHIKFHMVRRSIEQKCECNKSVQQLLDELPNFFFNHYQSLVRNLFRSTPNYDHSSIIKCIMDNCPFPFTTIFYLFADTKVEYYPKYNLIVASGIHKSKLKSNVLIQDMEKVIDVSKKFKSKDPSEFVKFCDSMLPILITFIN